MIFVDIDEKYQGVLDPRILQETALGVLGYFENQQEQELQIKVSTDAALRVLNLEYYGIDATTDVLSFPIDFNNPETGRLYLGDILVSYPQAERQAEQAGHAVVEEVRLLVVHGVLHLLGYDHATPDEKEQMWSLQNELLQKLGIQAKPTE